MHLRFHGVDQDSPRLSLSEGYRNSLGICIFLAMAKRGVDNDRPSFLDDVVVSLDRNHRGMIAELLRKQFGDRQVINKRMAYEFIERFIADGRKCFQIKAEDKYPINRPCYSGRYSTRLSMSSDSATVAITSRSEIACPIVIRNW